MVAKVVTLHRDEVLARRRAERVDRRPGTHLDERHREQPGQRDEEEQQDGGHDQSELAADHPADRSRAGIGNPGGRNCQTGAHQNTGQSRNRESCAKPR